MYTDPEITMTAFSQWLKGLFGTKTRRTQKPLHARRRTILSLEALEERLAPALQLLYGGAGSVLSLSELSAGNDPVTVSEPTAGRLRIDLGTGAFTGNSATGARA